MGIQFVEDSHIDIENVESKDLESEKFNLARVKKTTFKIDTYYINYINACFEYVPTFIKSVKEYLITEDGKPVLNNGQKQYTCSVIFFIYDKWGGKNAYLECDGIGNNKRDMSILVESIDAHKFIPKSFIKGIIGPYPNIIDYEKTLDDNIYAHGLGQHSEDIKGIDSVYMGKYSMINQCHGSFNNNFFMFL